MQNNILQLIIKLRDDATKELQGFGKNLSSVGQQVTQVGTKMAILGAAPTAALGLATKAAIDFESSFAGIRKTVDASEAEFSQLSANIRQIAKDSPTSVNELNSIGEMAGQLGVRGVDNLTKFVDTVSKIAVTTNLTAETAASDFARIANIMNISVGNVDRMASSVVDLGNNFATTESEVVNFASNIAGAGKIAGLTTSDVFGIAAAFSSVGIEAEAGGTAVQKVLLDMNSQGKKGVGAFIEFVDELAKSGDKAAQRLDDLGFSDVRLQRAFLSLAGNSKLLTDAVDKSSEAWKKNTALTNEAEKRYATTESQLKMLRNNVNDVGITLGTALLPSLNKIVKALIPVLNKFADFAKAHPKLITGFLLAGAAVGILGVALAAIGAVLSGLGALIAVVTSAVFIAVAPWILLAAAIAGIIYAIYVFRDQIMAVLTQVWAYIVSVFTQVSNFVSTIFTQIWTTITTTLTQVWTSIVSVFTQIYSFIAGIFSAIWTVISYFLEQIWVLIQFVFGMIWAGIQIIFWSIYEFIASIFRAIWAVIGDTVISIWNTITQTFTSIWNTIASIMTSVYTTISSIMATVWSAISTVLGKVMAEFKKAFDSVYNTVVSLFTKAYNWVKGKLDDFSGMVDKTTGKVVGLFESMASGIMAAIRTIKFPHLSIGEGVANVAGHEIKYPKLDVQWYEKGGWVNETGLAVVHEGEYVLSRAMLEGRQVPEVGMQGATVNMQATINNEVDFNILSYKLAHAIRTA